MSTAQVETPPPKTSAGRKVARVAFYIGIALVVFVGGVLAIAATKPDDLHVERNALVSASPGVVFAIINDLHRWNEWSPYDKLDPNMKKTHKGAEAGPGASYEWNGNDNVGEGRLTIVDSKPGELVAMKLEFTRPFNCQNTVNFKLEPTDGGTRVHWIMDGKTNFFCKVMSVFISMDEMCGAQFEEGLASLNNVAKADEAKAQKPGAETE